MGLVILLPIKSVKADCGWFVNANCRDVHNSKAYCADASQESFCSGSKKAGTKCCCCDDTLTGCCEKINKSSGVKTTMDSTITTCYANGDWANVKWYEGQSAYNNTCIYVKGGKECKWVKGSGGNTCADAGYPISGSLQTCVDFGLGNPSLDQVCCCREITQAAPSSSNKGPAPQAAGSVSYDYSTVTNPLLTVSVPEVVGRIVRAFLLIIGSIFLLIIIYGGFLWMTAAGNESKVAQGRKTLVWGVLGAVVIFLAWMIVGFIFQTLNV